MKRGEEKKSYISHLDGDILIPVPRHVLCSLDTGLEMRTKRAGEDIHGHFLPEEQLSLYHSQRVPARPLPAGFPTQNQSHSHFHLTHRICQFII